MKKLISLGFLLLMAMVAIAQNCNNGPFTGHNFQLSTPYTLSGGNLGVAVLYRNDAAISNPVDLQGLSLTVTTNGCGPCALISNAFVTSFQSVGGVATVAPDQRSATFGWNGVPSGQHFPLVDNGVVMVIDLGAPLCGNASCFDLSIGTVFMFANGANVPQNQIRTCERQVCKNAFNAGPCTPTYGTAGFFPSPYSQPTLSASDDYTTKGGAQTSAIQFWDPMHDPWVDIFADALCITGVHFEVTLTGDLTLTGWTSNTFPGASITQPSPDRIIFHYFGTGQQIFSSDVFLLLHFLNNGGCGTINICNVFIQTCQGEIPLNNVQACIRRLCIGAPGKADGQDLVSERPDYGDRGVVAFPNPFGERTRIAFSLPESMPVTFKVLSTSGQVVHQRNIEGVEGLNAIEFAPAAELASGIYLYQLETAKGTYRGRFVHQ